MQASRSFFCSADRAVGLPRLLLPVAMAWSVLPAGCGTAEDVSRADAGSADVARAADVAASTDAAPDAGADAGGNIPGVFLPPARECRAPLPGERAGAGPGGQVCTWSAIAGATEEGRRFQDYASCDRVRTQRPYHAADPAPPSATADPRMADPTYVAEISWVRSQIQATACVCCHSTANAPSGTSNWYLEAPGNWMDSFFDTGLALGAGWVDSTVFGAYPAADNNGFARTVSGVPSTDPERMARFFQQELAHRGRTRDSFASTPPFGGPIHDQITFQPSACTGTQGIDADGTIHWSGLPARYVYVLDQGSANPGVPPNMDLPAGTRWRIDVPPTATGVRSGITYGQTPAMATQRFPVSGSPAPLVSGTTYYLYVLYDVGFPLTRCTFTFRG